MSEWKKTSCVLCAQNCGLEVIAEGSQILKVRADRESPRSQGFICRKGANIAFFQNNPDRLKYPLKRVGGRFERISWSQALDEIAAKIKEIREKHGPRSIAYMGGGGQGCHFQSLFGVPLLRGLGSYNHYSALAQEHTGLFLGGRKSLWPPEYAYESRCRRFGFLCLLGIQSHGEQQIPQGSSGDPQ